MSNRREFLKISALGAAGAAVATGAASAEPSKDLDAVIIGGGFAGLTVARELAREGYRVEIVEARDRIGGRTYSTKMGDHVIELGGTWIHWGQPHVWAEVTRYGMDIIETPVMQVQNLSWIGADGKLHTGKVEELMPVLMSAFEKFQNIDGADGMALFPRAAFATYTDAYKQYDGITLAERLKTSGMTPDEQSLMSAALVTLAGCDPAVGGALDQIRLYRLCEGNLQSFNDRMVRYKLKDGTHALAQAMADDAKCAVRLSTRVTKVENTASGVAVHTENGNVLRAKLAVVTVPMNTLNRIDFTPPLMDAKQAAAREKHANRCTKVWFQLKEPVGFWQGFAPFPNPISSALFDHDDKDGPVCIAFGPPGGMDVNDRESVQRAVRTLLPDAVVVKCAAHDWTADKLSDGAWCWFKPYQMTKYLKALQAREGNLVFASGDSAEGFRGFIDGAIESGLVAAREALQTLRG
jgi:monoamine oxidase